MAKKKKNVSVEPIMPTPEQLQTAHALFQGDRSLYSLRTLKKVLAQKLDWSRGTSNGVALAMMEEGPVMTIHGQRFYKGSEAAPFVVEFRDGALTDAEGNTREFQQPGTLPGDLFEAWHEGDDFLVDKFLRHTKTRWFVKLESKTRNEWLMKSDNGYEECFFRLPGDSKPKPVANTVYEIEIDSEAVYEGYSLNERENVPNGNWDRYGPRNVYFPATMVRSVGRVDKPEGVLKIAEERHGIRTKFPYEVKEECQGIAEEVSASQRRGRVDLRDVPFVTIDGEDARDFDDAVYCEKTEEGWRLLVAIADVSYYVRPDTPLDREAQARGTSVYFPTNVVPMLPEALSNGICSLNPNVDRLTMVCDAVINTEGETIAYQFYPAVIRSHARLTYTQVWSALCGEAAGFEAVGERLFEIDRLYELYGALRAARVRRHALDFESAEIKAVLDDQLRIERFKPYEITDANRLIEECMLVANVAAADFVLRNEKTTLFRVHDKPEETRLTDLRSLLRPYKLKLKDDSAAEIAELLKKIQASPTTAPLQTAVLRTMARAQYSPDNIGHFGLQYEHYAHFTSPIRRYPDLLLHRTIKAILSKRTYHPKLYDEGSLEGYHAMKLGFRSAFEKPVAKMPKADRERETWRRLGVLTSIAERRADDASRDVMTWLACQWLSERPNNTYSARVVNVIESGVIVRLNETGLEGYVHVSNLGGGYYCFSNGELRDDESCETIRIGTSLQVRVDEVDFEKRRFSFVRVGKNVRNARRRRRGDDWFVL